MPVPFAGMKMGDDVTDLLIDLWLSVVLRDPDMPMPLAGMKMADEVTDLLIDKRHGHPTIEAAGFSDQVQHLRFSRNASAGVLYPRHFLGVELTAK